MKHAQRKWMGPSILQTLMRTSMLMGAEIVMIAIEIHEHRPSQFPQKKSSSRMAIRRLEVANDLGKKTNNSLTWIVRPYIRTWFPSTKTIIGMGFGRSVRPCWATNHLTIQRRSRPGKVVILFGLWIGISLTENDTHLNVYIIINIYIYIGILCMYIYIYINIWYIYMYMYMMYWLV